MSEVSQPLITKYRPSDWDEVIGNEEVIGSLQRRLAESTCPHAFLFTGPSGTGKTTLARIVAKKLDCEIVEIDAASNNGVDAMRDLVNLAQYRSLSGAGQRMFIIDESHMLSKGAFDALLKTLEEPPPHLYFALCTTEFSKIRPTIAQRCFHVALRAVKSTDIDMLLEAIASAEGWTVPQDVFSAVVVAANGSPRKAISLLQSVHDCADKDEVRRIIRITEDNEPIMDLLRMLVSGKRDWKEAQRLLKLLDDDDLEDAATLAGRYIMTVMLNADGEKQAQHAWQLLEALVFPADTYDRKLCFVAAIGRMFWSN